MPTRIFAITAARETVALDNQGRAEVSFTASNTGPKPIAGRVKLVALGSAKAAWLSLEGEQERNFAKGEAHQLTVHIAVPPGTAVGKYSFRLNIISVENPDDEFTEGPSVSFEVKELAPAAPPARKFPWWIVAVAAVVVLGAGIITWLLIPQKIKVPDVIGVPVEKAGKILQGKRLRLRTELKSEGENPGTIIDQNPKKDEPVAPGTVITAFVEPASEILRGHGGEVTAVAISDRWVVTAGSEAEVAERTITVDRTARLWDLSAKDPAAVPVVLGGLQGGVTRVAISPDNHWLVTGGGDFTVLEEERPVTVHDTARLWDLSAKDPAAKPVDLHQSVRGLAISPDSRWLAAGSFDGTARLWDLSAKDPAATPVVLRGQQADVTAVAISPDSHWLVSASSDNTARLWDLTAKDLAADPVILNAGPNAPIWAVAISNLWVVTGSGDKTVRLWDLSAKDPAANPVVLRHHLSLVTAVAISPDNHWLVTAGTDKTALLWDLSAKGPATKPVALAGHEGWVTAVAISPDSRWVVTTGSTDRTVRLWDLSAKDPAANPVVLRGHEGPVKAMAISPDSRWLVTGSADKTARLWDLGKPATF
jgi:WD40 repeat protein